MRRLLFSRHFLNYTGGHGKVLDYMGHADAHPGWVAHVGVHPGSVREGNPFLVHPRAQIGRLAVEADDALFLAGADWDWAPPESDARVVFNFIQGIRHAHSDGPLYAHLARRAIRICVSHAVSEAIRATGLVRGPVHVITPGLSLPAGIAHAAAQKRGVFIPAHKQPELGNTLAEALRANGWHVDLEQGLVDRPSFLARMARAEIAIPLPLAEEGFFLPGLEAMALGTLLIGVDAGGNREYLRDGENALVTGRDVEGIARALNELPNAERRQAMRLAGLETAARFSLEQERRAFHHLLDDVEAQWAIACS